MPANIRVTGMYTKVNFPNQVIVNACSNSSTIWQSDLSPFKIGPCQLYDGRTSKNMENAWQYSKVYPHHANFEGTPTDDYWKWAEEGWNNPRGVRYPMGKGAKPLHSWWNGVAYGYVNARKVIYGPLYMKAVQQTEGFKKLEELYQNHNSTLVLRDYDGYDHVELGMSLDSVVNLSTRKMGHAFVLAMLLLQDPALKNFV